MYIAYINQRAIILPCYENEMSICDKLEAFAMDDGWSRLIIFLLADPHLLEG